MTPKLGAKLIDSSFDKVKQNTSVLSSPASLGLEIKISLSNREDQTKP